jgi:hypothetical protein
MGEEHGLWVMDKRVLRKVLGYKRDKVSGEWRRLHYEQLHGLYSPNILWVSTSKRISLARHVAYMGDRRGAHRVLRRRTE